MARLVKYLEWVAKTLSTSNRTTPSCHTPAHPSADNIRFGPARSHRTYEARITISAYIAVLKIGARCIAVETDTHKFSHNAADAGAVRTPAGVVVVAEGNANIRCAGAVSTL